MRRISKSLIVIIAKYAHCANDVSLTIAIIADEIIKFHGCVYPRDHWIYSVTSKIALEFSGTIVRKPFAHGRYFIVDVISDGKLEMLVQDGKMKPANFQGLEIERYDNVKRKFVKTSIGNHLYSGISVPEGVYDSTAKTITFDSEFEPVPGVRTKDHIVYIMIDKEHYKWEYCQEENGKYRKVTEINFIKVR